MKLLNFKLEKPWESGIYGEFALIGFILFVKRWQLELVFIICGFTFTILIGDDGDI